MKSSKGVINTATLAVMILAAVLSPTAAQAGIFDGECDDTIFDPGTSRQVLYHTNHVKILKCVRQGENKSESLPHIAGNGCASSRVDGCSFGASQIAFTNRDKTLMKAACNEHDLCYWTYGTGKLECDLNLGANLDYSKQRHQGGYVTEVVVTAVLLAGDHEAGQEWGKKNGCNK